MASFTLREYHSESGALLGNVSTLDFGDVSVGMHSRVKVLDLAFNQVSAVGNVKVGIISSGGLIVNSNPTDVQADGSAGNGYFGIEDSSSFDSAKSSSNLSRHFAGINTTITSANSKNVSIGMRSSTISNYIYIDAELGESSSSEFNGAYKVFFDYS